MIVFLQQFFSSESIKQVWTDVFKFLIDSPIGVLVSICLVSFVVYLFVRVFF